MSHLAIRVENLSKQYRIGSYASADSLRELLTESVKGLFRPRQPSADGHYIWALEDVSLDLNQGEVLGVIGANGAGKSTLLKILSRITRPTKGRVEIFGRVASLLEVGTGFHPELTGRENIFMNAAILGMKRHEIMRKFDEIVDFAGVEKFIDTPVKRYSSGMRVRLAFSVAAHLDPEILIVDEVLSVGDAAFQKKSLGKMGDVSKQGRTILFVSHNLAALSTLCPRSILLEHGHNVMDGLTASVIKKYMMNLQEKGEQCWEDPQTAPGNERVRLHRAKVISEGEVTTEIPIHQDIHLEFEFWTLEPDHYIGVNIILVNTQGVIVLVSPNVPSANLSPDPWFGRAYPVGLFRTTCIIPRNFLNTDGYSVHFTLATNVTQIEFQAQYVLSFNVYETGEMRKEYVGDWNGVVRPKLVWETDCLEQRP